MNRILFAAARGARLDWYDTFTKKWFPHVVNVPVKENFRSANMYYRIHPADAHLEYGPVSSALREMAETGRKPRVEIGDCELLVWSQESEAQWEWLCATPMHRSLFLLLMAEVLADEGL